MSVLFLLFLSSCLSPSHSPSIFIAILLITFIGLCSWFVNVLLASKTLSIYISSSTFSSLPSLSLSSCLFPSLPSSILITLFPFTSVTLCTWFVNVFLASALAKRFTWQTQMNYLPKWLINMNISMNMNKNMSVLPQCGTAGIACSTRSLADSGLSSLFHFVFMSTNKVASPHLVRSAGPATRK